MGTLINMRSLFRKSEAVIIPRSINPNKISKGGNYQWQKEHVRVVARKNI